MRPAQDLRRVPLRQPALQTQTTSLASPKMLKLWSVWVNVFWNFLKNFILNFFNPGAQRHGNRRLWAASDQPVARILLQIHNQSIRGRESLLESCGQEIDRLRGHKNGHQVKGGLFVHHYTAKRCRQSILI